MTLKLAYGSAWADLTFTSLDSLASDSNLLAGAESGAIDNSSDLFLDALVGGKIKVGSSGVTAGVIEVWLYGESLDDDTYNDVLDGTDSAETITSVEIKRAALKVGAVIAVTTDVDRVYSWGPISVASRFGGIMPRQWGLFVAHNTTAALASSGNQHSYRGVHMQDV